MIRHLALLLILVALRPAGASPALPGFTGALTTPTTVSQAFEGFALGASAHPERTRLFLNYGLFETAEITLSGTPFEARLHGKWTWRQQGSRSPAIALGVADLFRGSDQTSVYAVAGGQLPAGRRLAGARFAAGVATRGVLEPVFINAEAPFAQGWSLVAEWNRWINAGIRVEATPQIRVLVGIVREDLAVGVSYDIAL
jgi:hypothetical protein